MLPISPAGAPPPSQTDRALSALSAFYRADLDDLLRRNRRVDLAATVLDFFRGVAREVPAYARFLEGASIRVDGVRTLDDFRAVPPTTKDNYHRAHPLRDLCRGGRLEGCDFVAMSSGSTGEPAVWPRFVSDEMGTAARVEQILADAFGARRATAAPPHGPRTLAVIAFALGSWVGGMYTTAACRHLAAKGYPLTLVTPGNDRAEILRALRALGPHFDQVVIFGYPPFLKDVIDAGRAEGLDWSRLTVKLITAGEVFSEEWRNLVCEALGRVDPHLATASMYGTADGGVLAAETPLSIRVRRFLAERPAAARQLFGEPRLPTLGQYDPLHRYFEAEGGELLFTGDGGAPLVRYRILDRGGVVPFDAMHAFLADHGFDPAAFDKPAGLAPARDLPFVYVFGRSSFALSFYGANVYPENVAVGLQRPAIAPHVTGKFVMQIVHDAAENPRLRVAVELAAGAAPGSEFADAVAGSMRAELERLNSEFLHYVPGERRTPEVALLPFAHPDYFPAGVKHRYTRT
jgi:phenylacetate-CoA ligase